MARIGIGGLNEGSLLRRTLLHVGTFVLGSVAFVGLTSFLLVSATRALLPAPSSAKAEASQGEASSDDPGKVIGVKPAPRKPGKSPLGVFPVEGRSAKKDDTDRDDG